jgi:HEAT repeat protein
VTGDDALGRRTAVALAGHLGDSSAARDAMGDAVPAVRSTALGALARLGQLRLEDVDSALSDPAPAVRRRAADVAPGFGLEAVPLLITALSDPNAMVVEAASFALGEIGEGDRLDAAAVAGLSTVAGAHGDPLCREAAVAALGSVGAPAGLAAILAATSDKPAVRRRAVLALAPFSGSEVDQALQRALSDRDWQVRQAAEDLTGLR